MQRGLRHISEIFRWLRMSSFAFQGVWYNSCERKTMPLDREEYVEQAYSFDPARADAAGHVDAGFAGRHPSGNPGDDDAAVRHGLHGRRVAADRRVCHGHGPAAPLFHALSDVRGRRGRKGRGPFRFPHRAGDSRAARPNIGPKGHRRRGFSSTSSRQSAETAWATTAAWTPIAGRSEFRRELARLDPDRPSPSRSDRFVRHDLRSQRVVSQDARRSRSRSSSAKRKAGSRWPIAARIRFICFPPCSGTWAIRACRGRGRKTTQRYLLPALQQRDRTLETR